jgi:penicillin amidase
MPTSLHPRWKRRFRLVFLTVIGFCLAAGIAALRARALLHASLPLTQGTHPLSGLSAAVVVDRDSLGVPTLRAGNRLDLARATGFLHAQERFFQMDLARRQPAGELSELLGAAALPRDMTSRLHRFRPLAQSALAAAPPAERALVEAYTAGVNAGLDALGAKPFEYYLLRAQPAPWKPEDTYLVALSMFIGLQNQRGGLEAQLGFLHDVLPPGLFAFLAPQGTEWDSPMIGSLLDLAAVPSPDVLDLRKPAQAQSEPAAFTAGPSRPRQADLPGMIGSNGWAVAANRSTAGALLANDTHLGLAVPNIWYRAAFRWRDSAGASREVTGVTLPGTPLIVIGSNTNVAWGFTNSYADTSDLVTVETDPGHPDSYSTVAGLKSFSHDRETIHVHGQPDQSLDVKSTIWGPIVDKDRLGRPRALQWIAHDPLAVNFHLLALEEADGVEQAVAVAKTSGVPAQNFLVADRQGRIGWTIAGRLPHRLAARGRFPRSWKDGDVWSGLQDPAEVPEILDPPGGQVWTANNRVVGGELLDRLGDGGYMLGARALQIHNRLAHLEHASVNDMLKLQLDDEAVFLQRWRDLLLRTLTPDAVRADPRRAEVRRFVESWGGHAATNSVGYALVRTFRFSAAERVFTPLLSAGQKADPQFTYLDYLQAVPQYEAPLWQLLTIRPAHLLAPRFHTWDELLLAAADAARDELLAGGGPLAQKTWGRLNRTEIHHPLSGAIPFVASWLDMPPREVPGDIHMPRFQVADLGASERMVVSPGREQEGIFEMPGGQSGNPLSPHYRDQYNAWCEGKPTPFLPGPTAESLTLTPAKN